MSALPKPAMAALESGPSGVVMELRVNKRERRSAPFSGGRRLYATTDMSSGREQAKACR